ncbi:leucine-rich repeat protein, putative [Leishmania panamensis]|uniref:Leucine-rich repeat protein, putative n=3 Tax=Leishmania guyanensis species complex TaxID=38579 RepID=A0A088RNM1_LEIPA|nr:leucine-rich repeat protein, putative [Leishmania panamensis]AIN97548.1 leucine-rich repeat protein, putative [Leishmania panamensis]CCM14759.1 leucine-rich repeat protein, putative [Leishmania guyanensis]
MADPAHAREGFWEEQQHQQQLLQMTRGVFEAMHNNSMQMLQMRVDTLERQVAMLSAQVMASTLPTPFQAYPGVTYGMSPATSNLTPTPTMPAQMPASMYYYQSPDMPAAAPANSSAVDDSKASKQLEDELQRMGVLTYSGAAAGTNTSPEAAAAAATMTLMHSNLMVSPTSGISAFPGVMAGVSNPNPAGPSIPFMTGNHEVTFAPSIMPAPPASSPTKISNALLQKAFGFSDTSMNGAGGEGMSANMSSLQRSCAVTLDPLQSTTETLEQTCQQTKMRVLCLKGCKGITSLNAISRLQNLWLLNLQGCSPCVDDSAVRMIATHNTRLSRLNLCGCDRVTDAQPLAQLSLMFDLNLSGTMIGTASLEAISKGCGQLSRLAINSCQQLSGVSSLTNLSELKLLYCRYSENIDPATIGSVLAGIGQNLLTLNVDGIRFRQLDLSHLPHVTALKNLNCKDNTQLRDLDWLLSIPNAAKTFESLEMLDVEGCESLVSFGTHITSLKRLKTMRLTNTGIADGELARLTACSALATLHLDGCAAITNVECLAKAPSLTKVVLSMHMQHENTKANGLDALRKRAGLEIIFAAPNNHHGQGSAAHHMTTTPTSRFPPSIPTASPNTATEAHAFS